MISIHMSFSEKRCKSQEDFEEFKKFAGSQQLLDFKGGEKCERNVWTFTSLYTTTKKEFNGTKITILMPSNEVEIVKQVRLYTMTNFIADFGGYLGLLLGASFMSFFSQILTFWQQCRTSATWNKTSLKNAKKMANCRNHSWLITCYKDCAKKKVRWCISALFFESVSFTHHEVSHLFIFGFFLPCKIPILLEWNNLELERRRRTE